MPWTPSTPQPQDTISSTTGLISGNFTAINYWTGVDHTIIGAAGLDEGKHNKVTLMNQAVTPPFTPAVAPATGVSALGLYALAGNLPITSTPANNTTQLYAHVVRKDAGINWTTSEIPFSYSILTQVETPNNTFANSVIGYTYLPSGIIMKWGVSNVNNNPGGTSFLEVNPNSSPAGPVFTRILTVQLTNRQNGNGVKYNNVLAVSNIVDVGPPRFTIEIQINDTANISATTRVNWLCIGY